MNSLNCTSFTVRVQFLEIYGDIIRDLLDPIGTQEGKSIVIRDSTINSVEVVGAIEEDVKSPEEMLRCLDKG